MSDHPHDAFADLHVVVPAGGAGTRLWPLSRQKRPKFLLDLLGDGRTLIQQTWDRLSPLVSPERIHVVTGAAHADGIREQLPELAHLLVEPSARDSMPAIGLAAAIVAHRDPAAIIGSFAADHVITDDAAFTDAVGQAVVAARAGLVATIGIRPTAPATGFGYIEAGETLALDGGPDVRSIVRFVEKPDAPTAERYLAHGGFSWNAGMFVVGAETLLGHLARHQPGLHDGLRTIAEAWDTTERAAILARTWPTLTKIAIDHAIAEPVSLEGGMAVVPGQFGWDDIGDFAALADVGATSAEGTIWIDADGLVLTDDHTQVAVIGVDDIVIVHTADALLVTTREHAQRVKDVPAALHAAGRDDLR